MTPLCTEPQKLVEVSLINYICNMKNINLPEIVNGFSLLKGLKINGALIGHLISQRAELQNRLKNYQEARNEIILSRCEKDKDGNPILINSIEPKFITEDVKAECVKTLTELDNSEFEITKTSALTHNYLLSINEISTEQFEFLKLFINE